MYVRIVIGLLAGAAIGGLVGYIGKCRTGTCPLTSNPFSGALWGGVVGLLLALALGPGGLSYNEKTVREVDSADAFEQEVLAAETPVLVQFYGPRCPACHRLAPTINELASEYQGRVKVVAINGDRNAAILRTYGVRAYPTVVLFDDGAEVDRWVGALEAGVYERALQTIISRERTGRSPSPQPSAREDHRADGTAPHSG